MLNDRPVTDQETLRVDAQRLSSRAGDLRVLAMLFQEAATADEAQDEARVSEARALARATLGRLVGASPRGER